MIKNSGIYRIRNLITNQFYIGSAVNLKKRGRDHFIMLRNKKHNSIKLQNAFNKHGESNFIFEILEEVQDKTKLIEREQYYLNTLLFASENDNRFNELGYNSKRLANSMLGFKLNQTQKITKSLNNINKKAVIQLDKNGIKIAEFHSLNEAIRVTKVNASTLNKCLNKKGITAKGFLWEYKDSYDFDTFKIKKRKKNLNQKYKLKPVIQLDLEGNFIAEYESIKKAHEITQTNPSSIGLVCQNKIFKAGNFKWRYRDGSN